MIKSGCIIIEIYKMTEIDRNLLIGKFLQIESWALKCRHQYVETLNIEKLKYGVKMIRHDLEELEVMLGVED